MAPENVKTSANSPFKGKKRSVDELKAVSGGVTTGNWQKEGCTATVEAGSDCQGTDDVDAVWDELIADAVGLYAAFGCFDPETEKRFLGIKDRRCIGRNPLPWQA